MIDDVLYIFGGIILSLDVEESDFDNRTTSAVPISQIPTQNGQSNFAPEGSPYLHFSGTVAVQDDTLGEWPRLFTYHDEEREGYAVLLLNGGWGLFEKWESD